MVLMAIGSAVVIKSDPLRASIGFRARFICHGRLEREKGGLPAFELSLRATALLEAAPSCTSYAFCYASSLRFLSLFSLTIPVIPAFRAHAYRAAPSRTSASGSASSAIWQRWSFMLLPRPKIDLLHPVESKPNPSQYLKEPKPFLGPRVRSISPHDVPPCQCPVSFLARAGTSACPQL